MRRIEKRRGLALACGLVLTVILPCVSCDKQDTQEEDVGIIELEPEEIVSETGEEAEELILEESGEEPALIFVHVCGQVQVPGVYELKGGSRVYEALEAAGGLTSEAAGEYLNQAGILEDGQQVYVPTLAEAQEGHDLWQASAANPDAGYAASMPGSEAGSKVNLNRATKEELMTLTGIGEVKAEAIIKYREEHGSFSSIEELKEIDGIKDGIFEKVRDDITV